MALALYSKALAAIIFNELPACSPYLRTLAEIYSPAYEERASSPSGLHAYKLRAVPVLLASHRGQMVEVRVQP